MKNAHNIVGIFTLFELQYYDSYIMTYYGVYV